MFRLAPAVSPLSSVPYDRVPTAKFPQDVCLILLMEHKRSKQQIPSEVPLTFPNTHEKLGGCLVFNKEVVSRYSGRRVALQSSPGYIRWVASSARCIAGGTSRATTLHTCHFQHPSSTPLGAVTAVEVFLTLESPWKWSRRPRQLHAHELRSCSLTGRASRHEWAACARSGRSACEHVAEYANAQPLRSACRGAPLHFVFIIISAQRPEQSF
jgi:hypothetical protein